MDAKSRGALDEFAARVRKQFPDARIWAYGSRVRGDYDEYSDLDVCVVVEGLDEDIWERIRHTAWEVGFDHEILISTVVYSRKDFEDGPCAESPLVLSVLAEGLAL